MKSNNSVISAIADNWQLDAMQENMCKYFFSDKDLSLVKDGKKCYVIGRKGAGKSAICQYLVNNPNYNQFAQKLTFKNFPFNELYSLSDPSYTKPNQYITLWKYLIYSTICKLFVRNESIDYEIRSDLENIYPQNSTKQLRREIKEWTGADFELGIKDIHGKIGVQASQRVNSISWIDKVDILEDLILTSCDNSTYYIVFDELDEDYGTIKDAGELEYNYIPLLTSLFKAVQSVRSTFINSGFKIFPIVFLRDDIYAQIKDADKNKWSDFKHNLEWNQVDIKNLLAYRISKEIATDDITFDAAWFKIFNKKNKITYGMDHSKVTDYFSFISNSTYLRPRDFIKYIKCCCDEAIKRNARFIDDRIIKDVDREFSNYMINEIKDELYPILPDIDKILTIISNIRKLIFRPHEFITEYNRAYKKGIVQEKNVDFILETLFNFSVIGNQHRTIHSRHFFKYQHTNMTYNKDENIVIHRGLFKALQLF